MRLSLLFMSSLLVLPLGQAKATEIAMAEVNNPPPEQGENDLESLEISRERHLAIALDMGLTIRRRLGPDMDIGSTYSSFDNDYTTPEMSLRIYPRSFNNIQPVFAINGGIWTGLTDRKGDSNQAGFITVIDGSNPALTSVTQSQNRRLYLDTYRIGGEAGLMGTYNGFDLYLGLLFGHNTYNYRLREMVSGGGPFFSHNLDLDMNQFFIGPKFGIGSSRQFNNVELFWLAWAAAGYNRTSLDATLFGTALPAANRHDVEHNFAVRSGLGAGVSVPFNDYLSFNLSGGGSIDTAMPNIDYPTVGGTAIGADSEFGIDGYVRAGFTVDFTNPRRYRLSHRLQF